MMIISEQRVVKSTLETKSRPNANFSRLTARSVVTAKFMVFRECVSLTMSALSSLVVPVVVFMTTAGATSHAKVGIMTTLVFFSDCTP